MAASRSPVSAWSEPTARPLDGSDALDVADGAVRKEDLPRGEGAVEVLAEHLRRVAEVLASAPRARRRPPSACRDPSPSGSTSCQPQEKTEPSPSSLATCFADSASHFTTWYQADAGCRPLRPPTPFWLRKLSMMPSRFAGIPIDVRSRDRVAVALPQEPVAEDRAERPDLGGGQIDLADDVGDLGHRAPPRDRVGRAGVGRLVDEQHRVRSQRREVLQEREHVRPVLRRRRAPGRRDRRAEELVLDDERRRAAAGPDDGLLVLRLRGGLDGRGIGRRAPACPPWPSSSGRRRRSRRRASAPPPSSRCRSAW